MLKRLVSSFIIFIGLSFSVFTQDLGNSPYSQIGLGDLSNQALAFQQGMSGSGVSYTLPFYVNAMNLSLLARNKRTIFEAGVVGQLKNLEEENNSQRDFGGSLDYLIMAFPVSRKTTVALGLTPYSSINYENSFERQVTNSDFRYELTYRGKGGLNTAFIGFGTDIINTRAKYFKAARAKKDSLNKPKSYHRLGIGFKASYLFGSVEDEVIVKLLTSQQVNTEQDFISKDTYSNFIFEPSMNYSYEFGKDYSLNFGLSYGLGKTLDIDRSVAIEQRFNDDNSGFDVDTLESQTGQVKLPSRLAIGMSIDRNLKWAFSADVIIQNFSEFRDFGRQDTLQNTLAVNVGGQYIPSFTSVKKGFWRRTIYRAGMSYKQTPLQVNGKTIDDISLSLGASIPFGRSNTSLSLAFVGGRRGTLSDGLIRENYYRIHLGITINDTWFIKRRFD